MSSIPTPYTRQASFTAFQTSDAPTVGTGLEAEFSKIALSIDETQARLAEIQRDDGALRNGIVTPDSLSASTLALMGGAAAQQIVTDAEAARDAAQAYALEAELIATFNTTDVPQDTPADPPVGYARILVNGTAYRIPYYTNVDANCDIFSIIGQSNAEGRGASASSPDATATGLFWNGVDFDPLADPVGDAATGSMWPAFANEWFALTGRKAIFVESALGSTRLLDYGDPDHTWAPGSTLRNNAIADLQEVIAAVTGSVTYGMASAYAIWVQGEGDAENLDGTHTAAQYEQALEDMATEFRASVPEMTSMLVVRSASNINDATKDAGYIAIRDAQENACTDSALLVMGYRGTYSFRPLGYMGDSVHYTQTGLNLAGKCAARGLYAPEAIPTLAAIPAPNAYTDTDYATASTTFTQSHVTAADTNFLVVAIAAMRPNSSTSFGITGVTYNGHAMTLAREQADNGSPNLCRAVASIWYIDETAYGGSLGGVTADIVVTAGQACNLFEVAAFNSKDADYIDYANSTNLSGDGAALSMSYYTGAPALTVAVAASCGAGAVAATCTLAGVTEVLDAGGTNATRTGQGCIGYAEDAAQYGPRTISATFSASQNAIALCVASFRKRWNGE